MSRIGKKPIPIPAGTLVTVSGRSLTVKGAHGTLTRDFPAAISFNATDGFLTVAYEKRERASLPLWGTNAAHAANMIAGVNKPFQKKLIVEGIGFKAEVKAGELVCNLGFSHPVKLRIPEGLKVTAEKGVITVSGTDIELVGRFAATIRDLKKPEPYKGKGIRYEGEVIRRKQGKKTV